VIAKTKTRSKNSSRRVTPCSCSARGFSIPKARDSELAALQAFAAAACIAARHAAVSQ
jgi:hypothetical protein